MKNHLGKLNFTYFLCFQHHQQLKQLHIPHIALALGLKLFQPTSLLSLTAAAATTTAATANMSNVMFSVEFAVWQQEVGRGGEAVLLVFALAGVRQSVNALYNNFASAAAI